MINKSHKIAPSILAADFGNLSRDIALINGSEADLLHIDVMDGLFVPNISFGQDIVSVMGQLCKKPLDIHLMIQDPDRYIADFAKSQPEYISVHIEACPHLHRSIQHIKSFGIKAGVALNPHTPVNTLFDVLEDVDLVVLMSVNPGFGGQKYIYRTLQKIKDLKKEIDERNLSTQIEIDGGVGLQNAEANLSAGADILVAGSSVFKAENPLKAIQCMKSIQLNTIFN